MPLMTSSMKLPMIALLGWMPEMRMTMTLVSFRCHLPHSQRDEYEPQQPIRMEAKVACHQSYVYAVINLFSWLDYGVGVQ
jgi:hypothetical protein